MNDQEDWTCAIERTYREMYPQLLRYATTMLFQTSLAEESVQEAFKIACMKHTEFLASENPKGWIVRTLQNVIRNMQRARARLNKLVIASLEFKEEDIVSSTNDFYEVEYGDLLPNEDYKLLKLIVLDKYSIKEAAEYFGITLEACKKRVQRAKEKLRKKMEEIEKVPSPSEGDRTYGK